MPKSSPNAAKGVTRRRTAFMRSSAERIADAVRIIEGNSLGSKERNEILFSHLQPRTNKHHFFKLVTSLGQCKKAVAAPVRWVNCQSTAKCDITWEEIDDMNPATIRDMSSAVAAFAVSQGLCPDTSKPICECKCEQHGGSEDGSGGGGSGSGEEDEAFTLPANSIVLCRRDPIWDNETGEEYGTFWWIQDVIKCGDCPLPQPCIKPG